MKILIIVLIACVCFSCKNQQEKLREQVEPVLKSNAVQEGLVSKVDSVHIYKIDTLTDVQYAQRKISDMNGKSAYYAKMADKCMSQAKAKQPSADAAGQAKMYNDSSTSFQLQAMALQRQIEHHRVDSKVFKGYVVSFKLSGTDKNNAAVQKDSLTTFLSPDLKVIPATKI